VLPKNYKDGKRNSGVYSIDPDGKGAFKVSCCYRNNAETTEA